MNFYVLECIITKNKNNIMIETIGIYSSEHLAQHYKAMCTRDLTIDEKKWMIFEYRPVAIDRSPDFITMHSSGISIQDEVDKILFNMVKKGYLEQLVGEDGKFYYELTEKGREGWPEE
jgi:hypothetical protein